jgi:hypothetical protein
LRYEPQMALSRSSGSNLGSWLVGIGVILGLADCGGSGTQTSGPPGNQVGNTAASSGGGSGSGSGASGGGSGAGSDTSGSGSGAGASSGGGSSGGSGGASDAGGGSKTDGGTGLANCQSGDTVACSSFTTPTGTTIQLGSYGAQMDVNVGKGFTNAVQSSDMLPANASTCQAFANLFNEDPNLTAKLLQTTNNGITLDFSLYSVYRPATWPSGKVPVITWGNGTCAQPEGYGALLRYVASYGYFVVAANSRQVGSGTPAPMLHALDFAAAANMDSSSPYYQKLDMTKVGAMGHSQGGGATVTAASDGRVKDVIIFNASDSGVPKPYLAVSGDLDITNFTAQSMASAINAASVPAAYLYYHNPAGMTADNLRGHLVLMLSPERVTAPTVAWWQMMFRNDTASHDMFVGSSCGLCTHASDYAYGANSLLK